MVYEQILTILLGTGIGVAVVLYTVKPRQVAASQSPSGVSPIETIPLGSQSTSEPQSYSTPAPEVTTAPSQAEAPVEVHAISPGTVSIAAAEAATQVTGETTTITPSDTPAGSPAPVTVDSHPSSAAKSQRAPRRASSPSRTRKPRAPNGSGGAIRKREARLRPEGRPQPAVGFGHDREEP